MISLEKRYENFKSTIEECGSYLLLEDDDTIKHNLFEEFSIDIISFLHEDTAAIADDALISYSLIFTAMTLPVLCGAKYPFAEQSVLFRL